MNQDSELLNRVSAVLATIPSVEKKVIFGSTAFMVQGKMCITARAERIMCRIDPTHHDAALGRDGCQTVVMQGRKKRGYVYVSAESVRTAASLKYWIDLALNYNKEIASTKK